jgi:hypothetical protein
MPDAVAATNPAGTSTATSGANTTVTIPGVDPAVQKTGVTPAAVPAATPAAPEKAPAAPAVERSAWSAPDENAAPAADAKPKAEAEKKTDVKYEFKVPEGKEVDKALAGKVESFAKELGLSPEQAQKVYDRDASDRVAYETNALAAMEAQNSQWYQELKADKDFGGDKIGENSELVKRAFEYADPDGSVRKGLTNSKHENWPPLVKMMHRFGKLFAEDKLHLGTTAQHTPMKDNRPRNERMADALGHFKVKEHRA